MKMTDSADLAAKQLEFALASGKLPADAMQKGIRLLERLNLPVRIGIVGPTSTGKSKILNFLAGNPVIPDGASFPVLEVTHGDTPRTTCILPDGSSEVLDDNVLPDLKDLKVESVKVELPLPNLNRISLTEFRTDGTAQEKSAAIERATQRIDILLWCGQGLSAEDLEFWAAIPDAMKDHSFFILTKADQLAAQGQLQQSIANLQDVVAEEFFGLIPVATLQAIDAIANSEEPDAAGLTASGAQSLMSTVMRMVNQGQRADVDSALMFVSRYDIAVPTEALSPVEPATVPESETVPDSSVEARKACRKALNYIQNRAIELQDSLNSVHDGQANEILDHCVETANCLVDLLASSVDAVVVTSNLESTAMDAAEVILLMQLERGDAPAADAVSVLLQLRKELESEVAQ